MNKDKEWMCQLCGCTSYEAKRDHNSIDGPGCREWTNYYECNGCSILFGDPEKFNFGNVAGDELVDMTNEFIDENFTEEI